MYQTIAAYAARPAVERLAAAAVLIGDFDPALARLFLRSPFQRDTVATVFFERAEREVGTALAEELAVFIRGAIDADRLARPRDI